MRESLEGLLGRSRVEMESPRSDVPGPQDDMAFSTVATSSLFSKCQLLNVLTEKVQVQLSLQPPKEDSQLATTESYLYARPNHPTIGNVEKQQVGLTPREQHD